MRAVRKWRMSGQLRSFFRACHSAWAESEAAFELICTCQTSTPCARPTCVHLVRYMVYDSCCWERLLWDALQFPSNLGDTKAVFDDRTCCNKRRYAVSWQVWFVSHAAHAHATILPRQHHINQLWTSWHAQRVRQGRWVNLILKLVTSWISTTCFTYAGREFRNRVYWLQIEDDGVRELNVKVQ